MIRMMEEQEMLKILHLGLNAESGWDDWGREASAEEGTWTVVSTQVRVSNLGFQSVGNLAACVGSEEQGLGNTFSFFTLVSPVWVPVVEPLILGEGAGAATPMEGESIGGGDGFAGGPVPGPNSRWAQKPSRHASQLSLSCGPSRDFFDGRNFLLELKSFSVAFLQNSEHQVVQDP